ncbi:MAG TPA: hypothetical protein VJ810_00545 [Blastocatellia bacterium]|nr:hypothetical protein [Blastocatellia bacterium]
MALAATFEELCVKLRGLQDAMRELAVSAAEDKPLRGGVLLADRLSDAAEDLQGWLKGALEAAQSAQQAVIHPADLETARQCLVSCQERFNIFAQRFASDLAHYDQMAELVRLGQERKGEWRAWAGIVRGNVERCQQPLRDIMVALFRCWQEVAERASSSSINMHATNIRQ